MNKIKNILIAAFPILFSLAISTNLLAADTVRGRWNMQREQAGHPDNMAGLALFAKLNLTEDQKTRIKAIRQAQMTNIKPLQEQMASKRGGLKQLWLQSNPDRETILAKQREIRGIRDQIEDQAIAFRLDVFNVLTPEQQTKAKDILTRQGAAAPGMGQGHMTGPGHGMMGN